MRGRKTPPDKVKEIVAMKLADPELSQREIAAEASIGKSIVDRILAMELGQLGRRNEALEEITRNDLVTVLLGQNAIRRIVSKKLESGKEEDLNMSQLAHAMSDSTKRYQLLTGGATENVATKIQTYLPDKGSE